MWNKKNIFEPSGCISRKAMEALINGDLPGDIQAMADTHMAACPFCSDAKEGLEFAAKRQSVSNLLLKVDQRFEKQINAKTGDLNKRRIVWTSISAAAAILIFVLLFNIKDTNLPDQKIAVNLPPQVDTIAPEKKLSKEPSEKQTVENTIKKKEEPSEPALRKSSPVIAEFSDIESEPLEELVIEDVADVSPGLQTTDSHFEDTVLLKPPTIGNKKEQEYAYVPTSVAGASSRERMNSGSARKLNKVERANGYSSLSAESAPKFKNGTISDFQKYIQKQVGTFNDSTKASKVVARFTVDEYGNITDVKIIQGGKSKYDSIIVREIKNSPRWDPAYVDGKPIKAELQIEVFVE